MKRNNKGITLIALVITIIIMLILAAVTISMAVNGGLFEYAGKGTQETQAAKEQEETMTDIEENLTPEQLAFKFETMGYSVSLWGDCNEDGNLKLKDAQILFRFIEYREPDLMTPVGKLNADVFNDGVLDNKDYLLLFYYIKYSEELGIELPYTHEMKYGDCNEDGRVNTTDVTILATWIASGSPEKSIQGILNADVNADGVLDQTDVDILAEYIKSRGGFTLPKKN